MSNLRKYSELGTTHRNDPCQEYPGEWIVYLSGASNGKSFHSYDDAWEFAAEKNGYFEADYFHVNVSICWKCSDNDPRIGEVWFTGFYQHGKFDQYGQYKST